MVHFEIDTLHLTTAFSVIEREAPEYGAEVGLSVEPKDFIVVDRTSGQRPGRGGKADG